MRLTKLNNNSRNTIYRFSIKIFIISLLSYYSKGSVLVNASIWLSIYASIVIFIAVVVRDRIKQDSFGHWDEAIWLTALALILSVVRGMH